MILILIAVVAFFLLGGKNLLFGGDNTEINATNTVTTQTQTQTGNNGGGSSIMNLLNSFMGSTSNNSAYDFSGMLSGLLGGDSSGTAGLTQIQNTTADSYQQYFTTNLENNTQEADTTVATGAREKYTVIK